MQKVTASLLTALTCATLGACGGGESADDPMKEIRAPSDNVLVYESRQSLQCGTRGLTTQQSAQKLVNGGIDVLESNCGVQTGVAFVTVCGAGTGEILIHKIRQSNLEDAERLGFGPVADLVDPAAGTNYAKVDCDTGAPLP
jgi:hypothetical protein